jgi:hypothetical protein
VRMNGNPGRSRGEKGGNKYTNAAHVKGQAHSSNQGGLGDLQRRRQLGEDLSLPIPIRTHELNQNKFRTHEHERIGGKGRVLVGNRTQGLELTPLYPGYGTHFSYVYVGTPPQRQSVIIDTGSHYTAFPCTGCSQCGQHTDNYWDMKNSTTMNVPKCSGQPCVISQSYSEGSSWKAIKVIDRFYVGALTSEPTNGNYSVDFLFGCQTSETGLFRTQLADGIMGMYMAEDTLPNQLFKQGVTSTKLFSLCYRVGGGVLTLGGVDQRIHSEPVIKYAKLRSNAGWFALNLMDISLVDQAHSSGGTGSEEQGYRSVNYPANKYTEGKGCIVDSGTTDTYLPVGLAGPFQALFRYMFLSYIDILSRTVLGNFTVV